MLSAQGANTDYVSKHTFPGGISEAQRRQFRATNVVTDIEGTTTGTLKYVCVLNASILLQFLARIPCVAGLI